MSDQSPTRIDLFRQASGDHDEYFRLCAEHGITPDGPPKVLGPTGLPGATWPDQPAVDADTAVAAFEDADTRRALTALQTYDAGDGPRPIERGDRLDLMTTDGKVHELVVTSDPQVDADGTVRFDVADPERVAAMERIAPLAGPRFVMDVPDGGIPNGHGGWLYPGPEPGEEQPGVDLSGWPDAGYVDETGPVAPALGLEPHHRRGKERTDEEQAALEPYLGEGCCRAAYYSDGFAHDHAVVTQ